MSTLKTDAITAVTADADLSLDGLGTGGVSIASTLKMTKGGDIASASPLVIDTDGNYFDVTGTTNFAAMTVESGNFFMLQFDGALTITHGSGIELPGAANLTTAAGDRLICYATAADTVEVMSVELETAASAGGFTLSSELTTTSGSSANFTSIPSGVKMIIVSWEGLSTTGGGIDGYLQIGDSGGLETSGYLGSIARVPSGTPVVASQTNGMYFADNWGGVSTGKHGQAVLTLKDSSNFTWIMTSMSGQDSGQNEQMMGAFSKSLSAELDRLSLFTTGTFDAGSVALLYQ